jgi:hypothetical protein
LPLAKLLLNFRELFACSFLEEEKKSNQITTKEGNLTDNKQGNKETAVQAD